MIYGLVNLNSRLNNDSVYTCLLAKGVKGKDHIYNITNVGTLIEILRQGDTVVVTSVVNTFSSVNQILQVFAHLKNKGVSFISLEDKYLYFKDGRELKQEIVKYICNLAEDEQRMINSIYSFYNLPNSNTDMEQRIRCLCMRTLARTFSADGILKRK